MLPEGLAELAFTVSIAEDTAAVEVSQLPAGIGALAAAVRSGRDIYAARAATEIVRLPPLTEADLDDLWELLPVSMQQAVVRGDVSLAEVLERMTAASDAELCPRCAARPVSVHISKAGWCAACARVAAAEASEQLYSEIGGGT